MLDIILTDEEEIWSNSYVVHQKDAEKIMDRIFKF